MVDKMAGPYNFAIIGVGGFIAPRHLQAIKDTGNKLVATLDPKDSVGIIDKYFPEADFFTEFERFDRHAEKLRRLSEDKRIHFVSICSPNYLHDSHVRFALRIGANAICEKPIVLNPWNLDALEDLEKETGKKVYTVLQLRVHPALIELKKKIEKEFKGKRYDVDLTYITPRGKWYFVSWKGDDKKSGGVATNIGVHFFDLLIWLFGDVKRQEVHHANHKKMGGFIELEKANVRWFLSVDREDLPDSVKKDNKAFRQITIDGKALEFSDVFADLHTVVYNDILEGRGFGIADARPAITLVHNIRRSSPSLGSKEKMHPFLVKLKK
jgi:UDP-N-acetyl-2-amino-2-deoxyglucuronate dehydrogenase